MECDRARLNPPGAVKRHRRGKAVLVDQLARWGPKGDAEILARPEGGDRGDRHPPARSGRNIEPDRAAPSPDRVGGANLREVREVVLVGHREAHRFREIDPPLRHLHRRMQLLHDPELGLATPPPVHHAPRRVTHDSPSRQPVHVVYKVALCGFTPVFETAAGDAEQVVGPTPDHRALGRLALHERAVNLAQGGGVVVPDTGIDPHLGDVAEDALEDAPRLVEEQGFVQLLVFGDASHGDGVVKGRDLEPGAGGGGGRAARIDPTDPLVAPLECEPKLAFVGQRPHEHRGVVAVACEQLAGELKDARHVPKVVRDPHPAETRLVLDVQAHLVRILHELGNRGIVRGANRVKVRLSHHAQVLPRQRRGDRAAQHRVRVMVARAAELHRSAVDQDLAAGHLGLAQADALVQRLQGRRAIGQLNPKRVQVRFLGTPRSRMRNR